MVIVSTLPFAVAMLLLAGSALGNDMGMHDLPDWHLQQMLFWGLLSVLLISAVFLLWIWKLRREIRAREQAERDHAQSEERLAAIMKNASEGIIVVQDGFIRFANPAMERLLGYSIEELKARPVMDLVFPDDCKMVSERSRQRLAGESVPASYSFRLLHREGAAIDVGISVSLMDWQGEKATLSFLQDITARKKSEENLRLTQHALDTSILGIYWVRPDSSFYYVNNEACRVLGYSREELLNMKVPDIDPTVSDEKWPDFYQKLKTSRQMIFESSHRTRSGSLIPVEINAHTMRLGSRELIFTFVQDVTHRQQNQEALRESERRFRSLFEDAPIGAVVMDLEGRQVSVNAAFAEMLGYSEQELVGKRHLDLTHPADRDDCQAHGRATFEGECDRYQMDKRFLRRDSSTMWGRFSVQLVRDDAGAPLYFLGMVEDVTERKLVDSRLKVLYRAIEHSPISVIITNNEGRIEYVNPQFTHVTGYSQDEALGETPRILKSGKIPPEVYADLWKTITSGSVWRGELVNQTKDGQELWEDVAIAPVKNEEGQITHYVGIKEDITERRVADERLRSSENSLKMAQRIAGIGDWQWDIETNSIRWSDTLYDIFGVDSKDFSPRYETFMEYVHPEDKERVMQAVAGALEGKAPYSIDLRIVRANGDVRHVHEQAQIITDEREQPVRMVGTLQDITSRKLAEQDLADSEKRFRRAVQDAPFPVIIHAEGGEVLLVSHSWEEISGYKHSDIPTVGDWFQLAYGDRGSAERERIMDIYGISSKVRLGEFEIRTATGKERVWDFSSAPLGVIPDGRRAVMSMAVDVTDRKRAERELKKRIALEELLSRVTAGFINITNETIGLAIQRALSTIGEFTHASRCGVYEIQGDLLVNNHCWDVEGGGSESRCMLPVQISDMAWLWEQVESGLKVIVDDCSQLSEEAAGTLASFALIDVRALLAVPLLWEGRAIGFLGVVNERPRTWSDEDVTLLETLAHILAQSMEGQRASIVVRRNMALKDALARLYEPMISAEASIQNVTEVLLDEALALTGAKYGYVGTVEAETGDMLNHTLTNMMAANECAVDREGETSRFPRGEGGYSSLWGHYLNILEPGYTNAAASHPSARGVPKGHVPVQEFLTVPVVFGNELVGQIALANKDEGFTDDDLAVAGELGRYFALAVQRLRVRTNLAESEERFRSLVETMNEGLATLDEHRMVTYVNHQFCKMLGFTRQEVVGTCLSDYMDESNRQIFEKEYARRAEGWAEPYSLVFKRKDGTQVFTLIAPTPLFDEKGDFKGSSGVMTDITKLKVLENQLVQAQKLESIGQLAAGIAHEINTPSQYVENNTRYLQKSFEGIGSLLKLYGKYRDDMGKGADVSNLLAQILESEEKLGLDDLLKEVPEAFEDALEGLGRITTIVRSVKQFAHPGVAEKEYVDVNSVIRNTVVVSTNEWKYNSELVTDLAEDLPTVPMVQGEMSQVLLNLIVNAAHAIADRVEASEMTRGTITVTTRLGDGCVEILVTDNGMGIPKAVQPNIFNPFFTTKAPGKGTGQGLAIAHTAVVEKHGGSISFETEEGKGTTFTITLPLST
ncbi:PAS/PAC sensor signal transduction histidine kinase [Desulfovibrio ferrophilus]|uniref:histidine kinase n=2 Tax=Desulfovibrio ferrophilus TaxID=241368 RepID=A0A2Z6AZL7_9BACT|nr:PAS/PAC sensor signal transduction histidine kinase [Desulfovibrio ferrophilus]